MYTIEVRISGHNESLLEIETRSPFDAFEHASNLIDQLRGELDWCYVVVSFVDKEKHIYKPLFFQQVLKY